MNRTTVTASTATSEAVTSHTVAQTRPAAVDEGLTVGKYHGLGNDFLVVIDPAVEVDAALARRVCDRHRGIGADGLVVGRTSSRAGAGPVLSFQLYNADGSEAEMSGNGMRCLAHAALDAGLVVPGAGFDVATVAGVRRVVIHRGGPRPWSSVEMGPLTLRGDAQRCNIGHGQLLVDVGNPHLVVIGSDPAEVDVDRLGPLLEATEPGGLNVEFAALGPGRDEVTMRVWERGVGETEACGTGSCAVAAAFHHWGRVGRAVTVHQPGGDAAVDLAADGTARLSGPSELVGTCRIGAGLLGGEVAS